MFVCTTLEKTMGTFGNSTYDEACNYRIAALVLRHEQQIKDIATQLLELKQLVTPMMEFKPKQPTKISAEYERGFDDGFILRKEKDGKRPWVGLTDDEIEHLRNDQPWWMVRDIEAKLKEKNGG
jgi:hypothetical protein